MPYPGALLDLSVFHLKLIDPLGYVEVEDLTFGPCKSNKLTWKQKNNYQYFLKSYQNEAF